MVAGRLKIRSKRYLAGLPAILVMTAAGPSLAGVVQLTNGWLVSPTNPFIQGVTHQASGPLTTSVSGTYTYSPSAYGSGAEADSANYGRLSTSGSASATAADGSGSSMAVGESSDTWIGAPVGYNDVLTISGAGPVTVLFTEVFNSAASATPYAYAFTSDYLFVNDGVGHEWNPELDSSGSLQQALIFNPGVQVTLQGDISGGCGAELGDGSPPDPPMASCSFQSSDRLYVDVMTSGAGYIAASGTVYGVEPSSAPEPASWALMLTGFGGLGAILRRRRHDAGYQYRAGLEPKPFPLF